MVCDNYVIDCIIQLQGAQVWGPSELPILLITPIPPPCRLPPKSDERNIPTHSQRYLVSG